MQITSASFLPSFPLKRTNKSHTHLYCVTVGQTQVWQERIETLKLTSFQQHNLESILNKIWFSLFGLGNFVYHRFMVYQNAKTADHWLSRQLDFCLVFKKTIIYQVRNGSSVLLHAKQNLHHQTNIFFVHVLNNCSLELNTPCLFRLARGELAPWLSLVSPKVSFSISVTDGVLVPCHCRLWFA